MEAQFSPLTSSWQTSSHGRLSGPGAPGHVGEKSFVSSYTCLNDNGGKKNVGFTHSDMLSIFLCFGAPFDASLIFEGFSTSNEGKRINGAHSQMEQKTLEEVMTLSPT